MKIVIIGAGPVGCYTAQLLKNEGISARIIEEDQEVGKPIRCAGLVGRQVFEDMLLPIDKSSIINQIDGADFFYNGKTFQIKRKEVAYVIDREKFDKNLSKGLNVECSKRITAIEEKNSGYLLKTNHEKIFADLIIGADGANSRIRKYLNGLNVFPKGEKKDVKIYLGLQYRIKLKGNTIAQSTNITKVYFRKGISFFIWVIPESNRICRVGVISENVRKDLRGFLEERKMEGEIVEKSAGMIPIGFTKNYFKNIALVGDAAVQVKPITGGGIYYGLKSAECLVECIREGNLAKYDFFLKKKFAREIKFGLKARKFYEEINEREMKNLFNIFKKNSKFIEKVANFENHSILFLEIFKNPEMLSDIGKMLSRNIGKLLF